MTHLKIIFVGIALLALISTNAKAQSPCYLVMLGGKKVEYVRVTSPRFHTGEKGNALGSGSTLFANTSDALINAQKTKIEIKAGKTGRFRRVELKIPDENGCHLLLIRDYNLRKPQYF